MKQFDLKQGESGYTIIELLAVIAIIAILSLTAFANIAEVGNPLANAAFASENYFRLARTDAMAHTRAIIVAPVSATEVRASSSDSCDGTLTPMPSLTLTLPRRVHLVSTSWSVCLTQRGLANETTSVALVDSDGHTKTVKVSLGGGTMVE